MIKQILWIVLICAKRSLCAAFSVLPYGESFYLSDPSLNHPRRRHSSGNISTTLEMLPGLEGFQLETYGRSVSYAQFLYPTNALVRQKPSSASDLTLQIPVSRSTHSMPGRSYPPSRLNSTVGLDLGLDDVTDYDPNLLSDHQWPCGKHKRVLIFASYMEAGVIACILLAVKISSDSRNRVKHLIDVVEAGERFRISRRELLILRVHHPGRPGDGAYLPRVKSCHTDGWCSSSSYSSAWLHGTAGQSIPPPQDLSAPFSSTL
ncbi:CDK5 and ABL1 enzyme substrate 2 [Lates japonicus]|uniref:CDK5 and ABL1 enzyme substrate 2 n=1 Tax=Lates japonicus TaxID=270547 RepID=A0AAD3NQX5_LATJO|nr:CDK5 and ABL1 enzyme substrate 2 [Lates japonicus]